MRLDAANQAVEEPPAHVVSRAQRLLRQRTMPSATNRLNRWLAQLRFDSRMQPATAGVRSLASAGWQLIFAAGDYELDVRIVPEGDQLYALRGQVLGECSGVGRIFLTSAGEQVAEVPLDELCEFTLPVVPLGDYALTVRLPNASIVVSDLAIRD